MQTPKLFAILPDYICTPDGMDVDRHGNLVLSCPNFAEDSMSGVMVRFDKDKNCTKWFDVPVHPETGLARNMGIAFDSDWNMYICDNQPWDGKPEHAFKGRVLKLTVDDAGNIKKTTVVADCMEHPNGIKVQGDFMYLTQSCMSKVKHASGKLVSCVYRFRLDDENIRVTNTLADPNIIATFVTENPKVQYGADGIEIDKDGNLYAGNFGDGAVWKFALNADGTVKSEELYAQDQENLMSTDGMCFDDNGNLYVADFNMNAIGCITPDRKVVRVAQSPDCDGLDGGLDQPGEPRVWNGILVASCFDLVTDETKVNRKHQMPATLSQLELL